MSTEVKFPNCLKIGVTEILELRMNGGSIREYAKTMRERYWKADCEGKARVLDEFIVVTGYHRKVALRSLGRINDLVPKARRGRCRKYGTEVAGALRTAWETSGYLCSKRLHDFMPEWTEALAYHGELMVEPSVKDKLCQNGLFDH